MFVKLLPAQLKPHWELIKDTIEKSIPECSQSMMTGLVRDLMLDLAVCWLAADEEGIRGIFITKLSQDYTVGHKTVTIVAMQSIGGADESLFIEGYETMKRYAKSQNCRFFDFYTNNPKIIQYANMFNPFWKCEYIQMKLE